jgi:hypothetical protein
MNITDIRLLGMGWIYLAQHRDQWLALVNKVMNLTVPKNVGNILSVWKTPAP